MSRTSETDSQGGEKQPECDGSGEIVTAVHSEVDPTPKVTVECPGCSKCQPEQGGETDRERADRLEVECRELEDANRSLAKMRDAALAGNLAAVQSQPEQEEGGDWPKEAIFGRCEQWGVEHIDSPEALAQFRREPDAEFRCYVPRLEEAAERFEAQVYSTLQQRAPRSPHPLASAPPERCARDSDWCDGVVCRENGIDCPNANPAPPEVSGDMGTCERCGAALIDGRAYGGLGVLPKCPSCGVCDAAHWLATGKGRPVALAQSSEVSGEETKDRCPACGSSNPMFSGCKDPVEAKAETGRDFPTLPGGCANPWHEDRSASPPEPSVQEEPSEWWWLKPDSLMAYDPADYEDGGKSLDAIKVMPVQKHKAAVERLKRSTNRALDREDREFHRAVKAEHERDGAESRLVTERQRANDLQARLEKAEEARDHNLAALRESNEERDQAEKALEEAAADKELLHRDLRGTADERDRAEAALEETATEFGRRAREATKWRDSETGPKVCAALGHEANTYRQAAQLLREKQPHSKEVGLVGSETSEYASRLANELVELRRASATCLRYLDGEVVSGLRDGRHTREVAANIAEQQAQNLRDAVERTGPLAPDGTADNTFYLREGASNE